MAFYCPILLQGIKSFHHPYPSVILFIIYVILFIVIYYLLVLVVIPSVIVTLRITTLRYIYIYIRQKTRDALMRYASNPFVLRKILYQRH